MKITAQLLKINEANLNGRIYTREVVETMIEQFNRRKAEQGHFLGELGFPERLETTLSQVSHSVDEIHIDKNMLLGDITVLDTPNGKVLKSMIEVGMKNYQGILIEITNPFAAPTVFRSRYTGTVSEDGTVSINKLISFDAVPADEDSFRGLMDGETKYTKIWRQS